MHRVYGVRLRLDRPGIELAELQTAAVRAAWSWARRDADALPELWEDGEFDVGKLRLSTASAAIGQRSAHRLVFVHPDSEDPHLTWRAAADVFNGGDYVDVGCSVEQQHARDIIVPERRAPGTPRLVRELVEAGVRSGRHVLSTRPQPLEGVAAMEDFIEGLLFDPDRHFPVVVITSLTSGDDEYAVPDEELAYFAQNLAGAAQVVTVPHSRDTFELTRRLGGRLSVFNGAMRVYWPRLGTLDSPYRHKLYLADRLSARLLRDVREALVDTAARAYRDHEGVTALLTQARIERQRAATVKRLETERVGKEELEQAKKDLDEWFDLASGLEADKAQLQGQIDALEEQNHALERKVDALQYQLANRDETVDSDAAPLPEPTTLLGAVESARKHFAATLHITDNALSEAGKMNSSDNSPQKLWRTLSILHEVVGAWQKDKLAQAPVAALKARGIQVSFVSEITIGRHPTAYRFNWQGRRVSLNPHVQVSRGERIYWYQDEKLRMFVVNHIGEHLPDSTTG